jgi:anti-sigma factor RsiW
MTTHLSMAQLIALRDGDRSEPGMAAALEHFATCLHCQSELERLHQRTARLRALPALAPASNEFPAVRQRITAVRQRRTHAAASIGLAAAATLVLTLIGHDLLHPKRLDAEQMLQNEMIQSQRLEQALHQWNPDQRVIDGHTAIVVIQLENRIAELDAQLSTAARTGNAAPIENEIRLWQQRVGLMNALVEVHLTKASNVGL